MSATLRPLVGTLRPSAVRDGNDLEKVTARVAPVDAPAAVVVVDLVLAPEVWLGVVLDSSFQDLRVDLVEVVLGDKEGVVLGSLAAGSTRPLPVD
jgi:hypothetical protein